MRSVRIPASDPVLNDIMTAKDVAQYLRMNERTVLKLAQEGKIPATKVASQWRFMRHVLEEWLESKMQVQTGPYVDDAAEFERTSLKVRDLLVPELVRPQLESVSKADVIAEMVNVLAETPRLKHKGGILLKALLERERLCSTGLGRGYAFLHPRRALINLVSRPMLAVGRSVGGIDFAALDGKPTFIFYLVCAPNDSIHLKMMAALARVSARQDLLPGLRKARGAQGVYDVLLECEALEDRQEE